MTRAGLVKRLSALVALLVATVTAGTIAVQSDDDPSASAGIAALVEIDDVVFYQVSTGDTWQNIGAQYGLAGQTVAIQNNQATTTPQPRVGRILLIIPGPPPSSTTLPPSSTSSSTTSSPTSTTAAPTTTVAPTTTSTTTSTTSTTTTTTLPGGQFVESFENPAALDSRFRQEVHHRNLAIGFPDGHGGTWQADHDNNCSVPTLYRQIVTSPGNVAGADQLLYHCPNSTGHVMSTVGDVDGYSVVTFAVDQVFSTVSRVCWDINVTNMGNRQWTEVAIVPAASAVGGITFVTSDFASVDDSVPVYAPGSIVVANTGFALTFYNGATNLGGPGEPSDPEGFASKAIRRAKCMTDNPNNTITYTQFTGVGTFVHTFAGNFPPNAVVLFGAHAYTPNKAAEEGHAFPVPGYTWHWDNVIVE